MLDNLGIGLQGNALRSLVLHGRAQAPSSALQRFNQESLGHSRLQRFPLPQLQGDEVSRRVCKCRLSSMACFPVETEAALGCLDLSTRSGVQTGTRGWA